MEKFRARSHEINSGITIQAMAPGRVNLIGEHIDYLGGKVMPVAIGRHIVIVATPISEPYCEISAEIFGEQRKARIEFSDVQRREKKDEQWLNYLIGILKLSAESGSVFRGLSIRITSDLPLGAGLSGSAALETAFSLVLDFFSGVDRTILQRALLCQRAEHDFAGVPCGIMDQIAVGAGRENHALCLDCEAQDWTYVELPSSWELLIADSGVKHALGDGEYRKRREQCDQILALLGEDSFQVLSREILVERREELGDLLFRRAHHVVTEMERVELFRTALQQRDKTAAGTHLRASHDSLRDDYEVSCHELDFLVDTAYRFGSERGLIGSRMTGGGFGGSAISLVETESAALLQEYLRKNYFEKFGRELDCFITRSVDGASAGPVQPPIATL